MTNWETTNPSYRAMIGEPASVMPAWPSEAPSPAPIIPAQDPQPLDALYSAQPVLAFLFDMARDAVEDVAILRSHRIPEAHESWQNPGRAEQRLLNQIDAAVNCGPDALFRLVELSAELETPDPDWMYAVVLVLGSIGHEWVPGQILKLLRASGERDGEELEAVVEALCLIPHPEAGSMLTPLLSDPLPRLRRAAVQALAYRALLSPDAALRLISDPDADVAAAASESFLTVDASRAIPLVRARLDNGDERIVRASLRVLFKANAPEARQRAISLCAAQPDFAEACLIVGLSGIKADLSILQRLLAESPSLPVARACGCFGDVRLVPSLIGLLADPKLQPGAAEALERLTGAGLRTAEPGPPRQITEPDAWARWWEINQPRFSPERRYRVGEPYGPTALLKELEQGGNRAERLRAYLELGRLAGGALPRFHPLDFIPKQRESLGAIAQWVGSNRGLDTGRWSMR
jgi:HEAT repeat protein